ncbi:MAG: hypothetical protein PHD76_02730 [Methylacidiphilales bacterium]|nr:hypothetical protein [Candidatus Methylacidiphilales bacterium]
MSEIRTAAAELKALLPHYISTDSKDERASYFRGLMAKTADSLTAIDMLMTSGAIWPLHCRWIVEAFGYAAALNNDAKVIDQIKKAGLNTYLLITDVDDAQRKNILGSLNLPSLPKIETLLNNFDREMGAKEGRLYKIYRLLCEYAHFEFYRTVAYPALGVEAPDVLEKGKELFLKTTIACALSLPAFAHCPPYCGFDNKYFRKITNLQEKSWKGVAEYAAKKDSSY